MTGLAIPDDRIIDGNDQTTCLVGEQENSNREGFIYWNGERMYGGEVAALQAGNGPPEVHVRPGLRCVLQK